MKYRIELAATAKADIRGQAQWLREQVSPAAADEWLAGLYKAIDTLQTRPLRCPVAAETISSPKKSANCSTADRSGTSIGSTSHFP
jgi:plasmid stabilization system protein ParE